MTKEQIEQRIREILAKDKKYDGVAVSIKLKKKNNKS